MKEQCEKHNKLGFKTTYLGKGSAENDKIEQGSYDFLFGSPEMCVGNQKWRDLLLSSVYQNKLKLIIVDEAHTVIQWYFISFLLCCLINDINMIFNLST